MKEAFKDVYDEGKEYAYNDQGNYGEIKPGISFFQSDITREPAQPVEFIVKKVNNDAHQHNDNAGKDDPFAGLRIHGSKIISIPE